MTLEEIKMVRERWDRSYHSVYEARTMGAEVYRALIDAIDISTDLLEACKALTTCATRQLCAGCSLDCPNENDTPFEKGLAAIAKAEGEKG